MPLSEVTGTRPSTAPHLRPVAGHAWLHPRGLQPVVEPETRADEAATNQQHILAVVAKLGWALQEVRKWRRGPRMRRKRFARGQRAEVHCCGIKCVHLQPCMPLFPASHLYSRAEHTWG
jgi:hypothetical protein